MRELRVEDVSGILIGKDETLEGHLVLRPQWSGRVVSVRWSGSVKMGESEEQW